MSTPKISVIVPVYNVEKYLPRCIDSILAQTFTDFELLLIDDGSRDRSGEICDEYAKKDNRIRIFHKENGGVSSARNIGLDNARGEWLAFIDSDDMVDTDYLTLYGYEDADVIEKNYCVCDGNLKRKKFYPVEERIFNTQKDYFHFYVNKRNNALWNKIIRRDLTLGIYFNNSVSVGEDFLFYIGFIAKVHRYKYSSVGCYYYFINQSVNSVMSKINSKQDERIRILWMNINNVNKILSSKELSYLRDGIIYNTYVISLFKNRHLMSKKDLQQLKVLFSRMTFRRLSFVWNKNKLKLYMYKFFLLVIGK